jgi:HTH-type transcriptional regulator / antitoxin HigA
MAVKNRGISTDLLIHPGETISDLLEERGITQKELAQRAGVSEAFLSDVIHGKKDISRGLAMGLEYALGIPNSFWLNLQANYDAELLSLQEEESVQEDEKAVLISIRDVVEYLRKQDVIAKELTPEQTVVSLRKVFQVSKLTGLRALAPAGAFRMSDKAAVNPDVLGAWLCLCKANESRNQTVSSFGLERLDELVSKLKSIMLNGRGDLQKALAELFSEYGIDFSIVHNFRGAPVHGYISRKEDGTYRMVLTLRGAAADIFWFSLFHELGHIVNGDIAKPGDYIDAQNSKNEKREHAADEFASRALLEQASYQRFVDEKTYSYVAIKTFAQTQGVPTYVVIGRLQKEEIIPWTWYQKYKPKYRWAEA